MRLFRTTLLIFLFTYFLCTTVAKKIQDDDFAEFEDFDQDEFVVGTCRVLHQSD